MATLLGKNSCVVDMYDISAKVAFNRALGYLPDSNFIYESYHIIGDENRVTFNDSGISGSCVEGCMVSVYSFKMPSETYELFIYHATCWYITIKCRKYDGSCRYIEFVFDEASNRVGRRIYEF